MLTNAHPVLIKDYDNPLFHLFGETKPFKPYAARVIELGKVTRRPYARVLDCFLESIQLDSDPQAVRCGDIILMHNDINIAIPATSADLLEGIYCHESHHIFTHRFGRFAYIGNLKTLIDTPFIHDIDGTYERILCSKLYIRR